MLEQPITVTEGWNSKTDYASVFDMVEHRMTKLYEGKLGGGNKCEKDPLLSSINNYVDQEVKRLLAETEKLVRSVATKHAQQAVAEHELIKALDVTLKAKQKHNATVISPVLPE